MGFITFLAAIGLAVSSFLLGVFIAGLHEVDSGSDENSAVSVARTALMMLFVAVCTAFILVEPALFKPLWLQYVLMSGVPVLAGYIVRRVLQRTDSTEQ